jgi:hypothetical protein
VRASIAGESVAYTLNLTRTRFALASDVSGLRKANRRLAGLCIGLPDVATALSNIEMARQPG